MNKYPFFQVDAFTTVSLSGNACAILLDTENLDELQMSKIAVEMNLPETVFVRQSKTADFALRFFTPAEEIPLAGHPTIATAHALAECGRIKLKDSTTKVIFELIVGNISVEIDSSSGRIEEIRMTQLKPTFGRTYSPKEILPLFFLSEEDLLDGCLIQTVSTGTPQLMLPLKNLETVKRAKFKIDEYVEFRKGSDFSSPHLFTLQGATNEGATFARHFFPPPDVIEDPFTGSATGGMAAYLWRYGLIETPSFIAEQGHFLGRPGSASVHVTGPRDDIQNVIIGGRAVTCVKGEFLL